MSKVNSKQNNEKRLAANNAADLLKLASDPAARVFYEMILYSFDLERNCIEKEEQTALIEICSVGAEDVIANTAELLNRVDKRFTFCWHTLSSREQEWDRDKVEELFNEMALISQNNTFTIHVLRGIDLLSIPKEVMHELERIIY